MAQSSGLCRGDYGRREPVRRKTTRMSGFTAGRSASLLIRACGACGSIILKRDMRLVAMNEMRVVEMRQEEQIPDGAGEGSGQRGNDDASVCSSRISPLHVVLLLDRRHPHAAAIRVLPRHPSVKPSRTRLRSPDHFPDLAAPWDLNYSDIARRCPKSRGHRFDYEGSRTAASW